jgi:DNA-binding ferritin-like protein
MHTPEKINEFRAKMIEHLEAALALADETQDATTNYMIERALDHARADLWPALDPWPPRQKP